MLTEYYQKYNNHVYTLPYGWNSSNALWDKPALSREIVQIGCVGFYTTPRDALILKNSLGRLFKENPQTLLVIGADLKLYQSFSTISEEQKLFVPLSSLDELPFLLSNFDILFFLSKILPFTRCWGIYLSYMPESGAFPGWLQHSSLPGVGGRGIAYQ